MDPPEAIAAAPQPPQHQQTRGRRGARFAQRSLLFVISFAILSLLKLHPLASNNFVQRTRISKIDVTSVGPDIIDDFMSSNAIQPLEPLEQCSPEQLKIVATQLPPDDCLHYKTRPWMQRCSFSYATRCPDAIWLKEFYMNIHSETSTMRMRSPFVGIFIGCNKGFDAFNALRMGSGNRYFDLSNWRTTIFKNVGGSANLHHSVCAEDSQPQFPLPGSSPNSTHSDATLHCIEPMPSTYGSLKKTSMDLNVTNNFKVVNAAFSSKDGFVHFPRGGKVGEENKGIANCHGDNERDCVNVKMYSLDTYVDENLSPNATINYLSVDVEGYDMDVLLGGSRTALSRTQYIEFEYNWVGPWKNQMLSDLIPTLENEGFACYWPGTDGNIWRITKCLLDHYHVHVWSNVACINRRIDEVRSIAQKMESMFLDTLEKGNDAVMDLNFSDHKRQERRSARSTP